MITSLRSTMSQQAWQAFLVGQLYAHKGEGHLDYFQINKILKEAPFFNQLENRIGHLFSDRSLLVSSLLHRSFVNEFSTAKSTLESNERLEFLGDAILGAIITSLLVERYPKLAEGELSLLRSALVNEESWGMLAKFLNLDYLVIVSRGEQQAGGYKKDSILANTFEALFGDIFLDSNYEQTKRIFCDLLAQYDRATGHQFLAASKRESANVKGKVQEYFLKEHLALPEYRFVLLENNQYQADLYVGDKLLASASDSSKKKAAKAAAEIAFLQIKKLENQEILHV